jgi:hypothetical protein
MQRTMANSGFELEHPMEPISSIPMITISIVLEGSPSESVGVIKNSDTEIEDTSADRTFMSE